MVYCLYEERGKSSAVELEGKELRKDNEDKQIPSAREMKVNNLKKLLTEGKRASPSEATEKKTLRHVLQKERNEREFVDYEELKILLRFLYNLVTER